MKDALVILENGQNDRRDQRVALPQQTDALDAAESWKPDIDENNARWIGSNFFPSRLDRFIDVPAFEAGGSD